jgi:hypothetical protein
VRDDLAELTDDPIAIGNWIGSLKLLLWSIEIS